MGRIRGDSWDEKLCRVADRVRGDWECLILHPLEGSQGKDRVIARDSVRLTS